MDALNFWQTWAVIALCVIGAVVMAKVLSIPAFVITKKKPEPPAVPVSAELLASMRSEIVHRAMKQHHGQVGELHRRVLRADFQRRGNGR